MEIRDAQEGEAIQLCFNGACNARWDMGKATFEPRRDAGRMTQGYLGRIVEKQWAR